MSPSATAGLNPAHLENERHVLSIDVLAVSCQPCILDLSTLLFNRFGEPLLAKLRNQINFGLPKKLIVAKNSVRCTHIFTHRMQLAAALLTRACISASVSSSGASLYDSLNVIVSLKSRSAPFLTGVFFFAACSSSPPKLLRKGYTSIPKPHFLNSEDQHSALRQS